MGSEFYDVLIQFNYSLQDMGSWLIVFMQSITFLGTEDFYALLLPLVLWLGDYGLGLRVGIMLSLSGTLNVYFQAAIPSPRPYWYDAGIKRLASPEVGFGFPSGHAQVPITVYGLIATKLKGKLGTLIWVLIILIGISRPILGMHFYTDTLAGWIVGGILLWVFIKYESRLKNWFIAKDKSGQISFAFGLSLSLILIAYLIQVSYSNYAIPQLWVDNAALSHPEEPLNPFSISRAITPVATMFGLLLGAVWLIPQGGYDAKGSIGKKGLRTIIGMLGILIFWMGLGLLFPRNEDFISYALRFVRYTLTGFWVSGLAPFLFVKWRLADPKK